MLLKLIRFTRVWVIQEAVLGRTRIVWCGAVVMDLDDIRNAANLLQFAPNNDMSGIKRKISHIDILRLTLELVRFGPTQACYRETDIKSVLGLFLACQTSRCSDKRDHVYGMLGLLPAKFRPPVNYKVPAAQVYEDATYHLIASSRSLEPLRLRHLVGIDAALPSWVLDFQKVAPYMDFDRYSNSGAGNLACFQADAEANFFAQYSVASQLTVRAVELDSIATALYFQLYQDDPEPEPGRPDFDQERYMRKVFRIWRSLASKHATDRDGLTMEIALWQAISMDKIPSNHPQSSDNSGEQYKYVDADMAVGLYKWLFGKTEIRLNSKLRSFLFTRVLGNMFFVTAGGRMGSVYGPCKVGDTVAILAGLSRPILLRRLEGEESHKRQVVSTCYCDGRSLCNPITSSFTDDILGVMRGEAIFERAEQKTGSKEHVDEVFTEITLV